MRTVLGLILVSVLIGMCFVQLVNANPFSFVPSPGPQVFISKNGVEALNSKGIYESATDIAVKRDGVYYLTKDLSGMWCIGLSEDVVLDGAGHSINSTSDASIGVSVRGFENVTIRNIRINGFRYGIGFSEVKNSLITNVTIANCYKGINIENSRDTRIAGNNQLVKCSIHNNGYGISLSSSGNSFSENAIVSNSLGISIFCCQNNTFFKNLIMDSDVAIEFQYANAAQQATKPADNIFYLNNFINNSKQISTTEVKGINNIVAASYPNTWNYNQEGNYWSDYKGNGSYVLDENNIDQYPLKTQVEINSIFAIPTTNTGPDPISINPVPFVVGLILILAIIVISILVYRKHQLAKKA